MLSFHSCWSLSIKIPHSLHKLWTISTTHAALRPLVIHWRTRFSPEIYETGEKRKFSKRSRGRKASYRCASIRIPLKAQCYVHLLRKSVLASPFIFSNYKRYGFFFSQHITSTRNKNFCLLDLHKIPPVGGIRISIGVCSSSERFKARQVFVWVDRKSA